ncbi:MAG: hypothetical protein EXS37_15685 [Opitutus sp.]|nr:hypothetical protein [Opitutus sp.]
MTASATRVSLPLLVVAVLLPACSKPAVESYRVPKETVAAAAANAAPANAPGGAPQAPMAGAAGGGTMANTAVATASGAGLAWTAPAHWTAKTGSAMRKGSYAIKADGMAGEADLSITAFPGDVGGDLANLNRWRGQIQLPPISQAELEAATQHLDRNGLHLTVVDLAGAGATAQRILGAMVPHNGSTWFFKLMGPDALVAKEKPAFTTFLDTVKPAAAAK